MQIETIGYIRINKEDTEKIEDWVTKFKLCTYDSHEEEIITDFRPEALDAIKGSLISEDEAKKILEQCDLIKFYY